MWSRAEVHAPGTSTGAAALAVEVRALGASATADRLEAQRAAWAGLALLGLLAVGLLLLALRLRRRLAAGWPRTLGWAALVLLARAALGALDLPGRFPALAAGFAPTDFGIDDPLGWLGSPGDLALTALCFLALCLLRGPQPGAARSTAPAATRPLAALLGVALAAGATLLWLVLLRLAVEQGRTPFFESSALLPPGPVVLMLVALVGATAGACLLAVRGAQQAACALPSLPGWLARVLAALLAGLPAWLLLEPQPAAWACLLLGVPAVLAPLARPRDGSGRAGSVLLLGVVATLVLFPMLRSGVRERSLEALLAQVERVVQQREAGEAEVRLDLASLQESERLQAALAAAGAGGRAPGLALELWLQGSLAPAGRPGVLEVLDAQGRLLDAFGLDATPRSRLPEARPPSGPADLEVLAVPGAGARIASVTGRLRVRAAAGAGGAPGAVLGHVVLTVPDPVDLRVLGLDPGEADSATSPTASARRPVEVALLQQGRVVASSSPQASREPGGFVAGLLDDHEPLPSVARAWQGREVAAAWLPGRAQWFVARRAAPDLGEEVLALARLLVVGVGAALVVALLVFLATLRRLEVRLHHRILGSYFVVSVLPLLLLAWVTADETRTRYERAFSDRLENDLVRVRSELEGGDPARLDRLDDEALRRSASERRHDLTLYRGGVVSASSRAGAVAAELLPARLDAEAFQASVLERRTTVRREVDRDGRLVWTGYAPVLGPDGWARATVAVPLLYERDRIDEQLSVTGSVVLAGYLLTLVLVVALGLLASRRLAQPLDELVHAAEQVAQGDLEVALHSQRDDEFGRLMRAFDEMTRSLRAATERAARAEREQAWRRMARQVAHEIKNPLSPMKLMVQQMEADSAADPAQAPQAVQRTAAVLLRQIDALSRIATTFGDLSRLPVRRPAAVDVRALAQHVVDLHAGARAHGVTVRAELDAGLPTVVADEEELRRVLVNLVNNAVQSVPGPGEVVVAARAGTSSQGRHGLCLEVRDTGTGIPPEHRDMVFEPTFSTRTAGTGLGLAIVKRIVDDHGGEVGFEPRPGGGTTFRVWLPLGPSS
ncbi:MAG: ATP-binding protein [Planctomycetia bacterium]